MKEVILQYSNSSWAPAENVDCNTCRILVRDTKTNQVTEVFRDEEFSEAAWLERMRLDEQTSWLNLERQ